MPLQERTYKRSTRYSEWHRPKSIKRFLAGNEILANRLTMIDIDGVYVEAKHPYDRPPVALIETVEVSRRLKPGSYYKKSVNILYQLGKAANIPVFLVLYLPGKQFPDISEFYVKEYYPGHNKKWKVYSPDQYSKFLVYLRQNHTHMKKNGPQLVLPFNPDLLELDDDDLERRWYVNDWEKRKFVK